MSLELQTAGAPGSLELQVAGAPIRWSSKPLELEVVGAPIRWSPDHWNSKCWSSRSLELQSVWSSTSLELHVAGAPGRWSSKPLDSRDVHGAPGAVKRSSPVR